MSLGQIIQSEGGGVRIAVKVVPGASRSKVVGRLDGRLKVAVAAPPEGGKANEAACQLFASLLGLRKSQVSITSGHTRPQKVLHIDQVDSGEVTRAVRAVL